MSRSIMAAASWSNKRNTEQTLFISQTFKLKGSSFCLNRPLRQNNAKLDETSRQRSCLGLDRSHLMRRNRCCLSWCWCWYVLLLTLVSVGVQCLVTYFARNNFLHFWWSACTLPPAGCGAHLCLAWVMAESESPQEPRLAHAALCCSASPEALTFTSDT